MRKINILFIVLLILIVGGIISGIVISQHRKIPDETDYQNFCGFDKLEPCDSNGKCSCEGTCYDVVDNVNAPSCITNPNVPCSYSYKDPTTKENKYIPSGKWCLPEPIKSLQCNPYTGTPTLSKNSDGELVWNCVCNADVSEILEKSGEFGDCNVEKCNIVDRDDDSSSWYKACYNDDGTPKDDFKNCWDPAENGVCKCPPGQINPYKNKDEVDNFKCVADSCYDIDLYPDLHGTNYSYSSCNCPPKETIAPGVYRSFISCPENTNNNSNCSADPNAQDDNRYNSCSCGNSIKYPGLALLGSKDEVDISSPMCIPDPCNPGGYFDTEQNTCVCEGNTIQQQSYSSPVGMICADIKSNNICAERGTGCVCCKGTKLIGDFSMGSNKITNITGELSNISSGDMVVPYNKLIFGNKKDITINSVDVKTKTITLSEKAINSSAKTAVGIPSEDCVDKECPICPECSDFTEPGRCNSTSGCTFTRDDNGKGVCTGSLDAVLKCKDCNYPPWPAITTKFNLQDNNGYCLSPSYNS